MKTEANIESRLNKIGHQIKETAEDFATYFVVPAAKAVLLANLIGAAITGYQTKHKFMTEGPVAAAISTQSTISVVNKTLEGSIVGQGSKYLAKGMQVYLRTFEDAKAYLDAK